MTHDIPKIHYIDDSFERESGYFEQGEWIFNYELRFFENKDSCSRDDDKWEDKVLAVNLVMITRSVVVDNNNNIFDQTGLDDNEEIRALEIRIERKKKGRRQMKNLRSDWVRVPSSRQLLMGSDALIDSMKRTHYESGKRSRGRYRPSFT